MELYRRKQTTDAEARWISVREQPKVLKRSNDTFYLKCKTVKESSSLIGTVVVALPDSRLTYSSIDS